MDSHLWDERYAAAELVWSAGPNEMVAALTADLPPGRVLDVAAGEGRNAIWLAERGWAADAVDFSRVGLDRAERIAAERLTSQNVTSQRLTSQRRTSTSGQLVTIHADVTDGWEPRAAAYDLVLVVFLHLPAGLRAHVHRTVAAGVAPGGRLLILAHDRSNLTEGVGGPQDPAILPTPAEVADDLADTGLELERAEIILRAVAGAERPARDCLVLARRPS
jgi:SAM-dependent methyltransferase